MKDDTLELIVRNQEAMYEEVKALREDISELRVAFAFQRGKERGRAAIIGTAAGFVSSILVHILGPTILEFLHIKK